jgi:16S rRNA (cytosine1402-N4)-methyltransferase
MGGVSEVTPTHVPVLLETTIELLSPALSRSDAVCIDATVGLGGHSAALLAAFPNLTLIGIDRDESALAHAANRLAAFSDRVHLIHDTYDHMAQHTAALGVTEVNGVLMDLGVSSMQLDQPARGFAYSYDAPLDMRMDPSNPLTAAKVLAEYPQEELSELLRTYGEERYARRIAAAIVNYRQTTALTTSAQLTELLSKTIPASSQRSGGHPAKRTFQALRIEVNDELGTLRRALPAALALLAVGGRLAVMAYHSLEDRMVKKTFTSVVEPSVPVDLPVIPHDARPRFARVTRGAQVASPAEVAVNPRAASVRLRVIERIRETS